MIDTIQLLTITTDSSVIGMDSAEVARALLDMTRTDTELIDVAKTEKRFYNLGKLLDPRYAEKEESFLVIKPGAEKPIMVAFTGVVDFLKIRVSGILAVPDYIKIKQKPFFVWGFARDKEKLVTLVTFCFLSAGGAT
jgi:hypothetical protein